MHQPITIFLFTLSFTLCKAEYNPIFLPTLIENAEVIAHIKIDKVMDAEFEASIIQIIKGVPKSKKIRISKFRDWTCAQRWTKYMEGQEELIFLKRQNEKASWLILGDGNEGEMPIENGKLYYKTPFFRSKFFNLEKLYALKSGHIFGVEYAVEEIIKGIQLYFRQQKELEKMMENKSILSFYSKNKFFQRAIDEKILSSRIFNASELHNRNFENQKKW